LPELVETIQAVINDVDTDNATGFGQLIPDIRHLMLSRRLPPGVTPSDLLVKRAGPLVLEMASACLGLRFELMAEIAPRLIGLGQGLTPSGDDFLGGLLFALHGLYSSFPEAGSLPETIRPTNYVHKTHPISGTLLSDLAQGHAISPLQGILNSVLCAAPLISTHSSTLALIKVGHSTGWDLLTGLLTGLLVAIGWNQKQSQACLRQQIVL
jgi:hypothetical protein